MPFRIQYGPIASALKLAQQAGAGQEFWQRHAAEQQMVAQVHRRRQIEQEIALRQRGQDIEAALSMASLQQREAASQRQFVAQQADAQARRALTARREARYERGEQRAEESAELAAQREARLRQTAEARQERIEADPTKNDAYLRMSAAIRNQEDKADSFKRQAAALERPIPGGGKIVRKSDKPQYDLLLKRQSEAEQQLQNLLDARQKFLNNTMPQYQAAQAAGAAAQATQLKPAGQMEPKGVSVSVGGRMENIPAPPQQLTAPYSGARITEYPTEAQGLKEFYMDVLKRKVGVEKVMADFENARRGYHAYAQRQGWSLQ